jgi:hypothetical protein
MREGGGKRYIKEWSKKRTEGGGGIERVWGEWRKHKINNNRTASKFALL